MLLLCYEVTLSSPLRELGTWGSPGVVLAVIVGSVEQMTRVESQVNSTVPEQVNSNVPEQ